MSTTETKSTKPSDRIAQIASELLEQTSGCGSVGPIDPLLVRCYLDAVVGYLDEFHAEILDDRDRQEFSNTIRLDALTPPPTHEGPTMKRTDKVRDAGIGEAARAMHELLEALGCVAIRTVADSNDELHTAGCVEKGLASIELAGESRSLSFRITLKELR